MKKNKNNDIGNIVFFVGVVIFVVALCVGYFLEAINAIYIDLTMGLGLLIEFVGLCITYRTSNRDDKDENKSLEDKTINEIKEKEKKNDREEVIEVEEKIVDKDDYEELLKEEAVEKKTKAKTTSKTNKTNSKTSSTKKKNNNKKKNKSKK